MNIHSLAQCSSYFSQKCLVVFETEVLKTIKYLKKESIMLRCGLIRKKKTTSEVFEFSILAYTQNQKLGNLGKSYLLKFLVACET